MRTPRLAIGIAAVLSLGFRAAAQTAPGPEPQTIPGTQTPASVTPNGLLTSSIPNPAAPAGGWVRRQIAIAPCAVPPAIDGSLDDPCWRTATHAAGFYRWTSSAPVVQQTEAWLCADKTHLYIAFHCLDSEPDRIRASETLRDGNLGNDDTVEVDIDSQNSHRNNSWFVVSARGTQQEHLEGGTADNITWAGDWKAAAQRTPDGWTAEMSIPFALLRYPRGARSFGLCLLRKLARETSFECWPYMPSDLGWQNETQYMAEFIGIAPPFFAPRPVFLPYVLAAAGAGESVRQGLDIKYPLTTTLTGVATAFPDFQTIEQDVTNINFSYTEKFLTDRRPFFAEGSGFLPGRDLFYSRRITAVDGGLKVVGKQGATSIGLLTTAAQGADAQGDAVMEVRQDIGLFSHALVDFVGDNEKGQPSSRTAKFEGGYGWQSGRDNYAALATHIPSWQGGAARDSKDYYNFSYQPRQGRPAVSLDYTDIGPSFVSPLGFNPELDLRGPSLSMDQFNQFDRGRLEFYDVGLSVSSYQHHTGGFFHDGVNGSAFIGDRSGYGGNLGFNLGQRDAFHDRTLNASFSWGRKTLYQQGSVGEQFGQQAGQPYNFLSLSQGVFVSRPFSLQFNYSRLRLGGARSTQTILTGTYRLNAAQAIGGRLVSQGGTDQGTGLGTNLYFSFSQHVRAGSDLYVLLGDPNSPRTRGLITVKVITPF